MKIKISDKLMEKPQNFKRLTYFFLAQYVRVHQWPFSSADCEIPVASPDR